MWWLWKGKKKLPSLNNNLQQHQFHLSEIQNNEEKGKEYLEKLPIGVSFTKVISIAYQLCPELEEYCSNNQSRFSGMGKRDKGSMGKMVEFYIFGQLPDTNPLPDLSWGADIKTTHFKEAFSIGYNAKERLTITNVGNTENYETFSELLKTNTLQSSYYYKKIRKGVLFVFEHNTGIYNSLEMNMEKKLLCSFTYDLEYMSTEITNQLNNDFNDIRNKITTQTVSQSGQKYLHIHPHGSKGQKTRALGFTNKFVTKLVSEETGKPITVKGKSWFIKKSLFREN